MINKVLAVANHGTSGRSPTNGLFGALEEQMLVAKTPLP
jgi:hypothetical protein